MRGLYIVSGLLVGMLLGMTTGCGVGAGERPETPKPGPLQNYGPGGLPKLPVPKGGPQGSSRQLPRAAPGGGSMAAAAAELPRSVNFDDSKRGAITFASPEEPPPVPPAKE